MKHDLKNEKRVLQHRLKSPVFWTAVTAQVASILVLTGVIDSGESETLRSVSCAILEALVTFGILNDPTNGAAF